MSRPRGNKTTTAARQVRRARVAQALAENKPKTAVAEELGISYATLWRDLTALQKEYQQAGNATFADRQEQLKRKLDALEKATLQGLPESVGRILLGINHQRAKIDGLYAESRVLHAHVSASTDTTVLEFRKHADGLTGDDLQKVWAFMDSLPRTPQATVRDASWYPEPEPKLLEGQ